MRRVPHPAGTVGSVTAKPIVLQHFSCTTSPQKRLRRNGLAAAPGVPPRHFPESTVAASMSVSAADRACSKGEVSLSEVARALAPSKSTASWLPSR
jgi:hypothetical protein